MKRQSTRRINRYGLETTGDSHLEDAEEDGDAREDDEGQEEGRALRANPMDQQRHQQQLQRNGQEKAR